MKFKLWIIPEIAICKETGKLHAWTADTNEKVYDLSLLEVEEPHRKYTNIEVEYNGNHISEYVRNLKMKYYDDVTCTSVNRFLECFPDWEEDDCGCCDRGYASDEEEDPEDWTYTNHIEFKDALEYLVKKNIAFRVEW